MDFQIFKNRFGRVIRANLHHRTTLAVIRTEEETLENKERVVYYFGELWATQFLGDPRRPVCPALELAMTVLSDTDRDSFIADPEKFMVEWHDRIVRERLTINP